MLRTRIPRHHGPFARLTYEEAKVDAWSETGTSSDSYVLFDVGVSGEIGNSRITGFVSINAAASKSDGNYQAITVGIRAPL